MEVYLDVVVALSFLIDFLLLAAADRLCGFQSRIWKLILGGIFGGVYGGVCLLPGFRFLGNLLWRIVSLVGMGMIAFGLSVSAFRRSCIFALLSMAMGGIAMGMGQGGFVGMVACAAVLMIMCVFGFRERIGSVSYIPVELQYRGKSIKLNALKDTGNTLKDPITGADVLIICAQAAQQILGLSEQQLRDPVNTIGSIPGLRLVPYHTVGQSDGLLLAMRLPDVKIGSWRGSRLVAFAPNGLSADGTYQALTGGNL